MKNHNLAFAAGAFAVLLGSVSPAYSVEEIPARTQVAPNLAGLHDFDFLVGEWHIAHHRLKERLVGCHEWQDFDGTCAVRTTMDGWGDMDDNVINLPEGSYRAVGLRAYDPKTGQWAIWWLDGRNPFGDLDPPVKGRFENGVGSFYTDDTLRGKPIRVRFVWSKVGPSSAHWEQSFSPDGGKTWEMNWAMDLTRTK
jgi:hypothetical protein